MARRNYNRKPLPKEPRQALIESLNHDARGVAHVDGKVVFIDGALPGENIAFTYTGMYRDYAEGRVLEVLDASPERIAPHCAHAGVCGGCSLQHLEHEAQIRYKQQLLLEQLRRIGKVQPQDIFAPLRGPLWGYRHKARLSVKYVQKKGKALVGFREKASPFVADIGVCPVLHPIVGEHLAELGELVGRLSLRDQLPQIEIGVGDQHCALVFRLLRDATADDLAALRAFGEQHGYAVYTQRQGPDSIAPVHEDAAALPSYALPEADVQFHFNPTEFTQVNPAINRAMVARALELLAPQADEDVLDLFCGLGNFTLPLARQARSVTGVEGDAPLVQRARDNAARNGIGNVEFFAADLFHALPPCSAPSGRFACKSAVLPISTDVSAAPWAQRRYHKILLDPARAGAQEIVRQLPRFGAGRVVYISCNPATLARDASILANELGYRLLGAGIMDMFPHTAHVESIALFER